MPAIKQIDKIKVSKKRIEIEWSVYHSAKEDPDEYVIRCREQAVEAFYKCVDRLIGQVIGMLELPASYAQGMEIRGISFDYVEGTMGAVITVIKRLERGATIVINTPHKPSKPYGKSSDRIGCMSIECWDILRDVTKYAEGYIDGERSQTNLFPEEPVTGKQKGKGRRAA